MADYSNMTDTEFADILSRIMDREPASALLQVPGVYEAVSEHFNNEVLDEWAEDNPERAYPEA